MNGEIITIVLVAISAIGALGAVIGACRSALATRSAAKAQFFLGLWKNMGTSDTYSPADITELASRAGRRV